MYYHHHHQTSSSSSSSCFTIIITISIDTTIINDRKEGSGGISIPNTSAQVLQSQRQTIVPRDKAADR